MEIERRFLAAATGSIDTESREGGLASIRGITALYYDGTPRTEFRMGPNLVERIMPGAFSRTLKEGNEVVALFNHDENNVLGRRSAKTLRLFDDAVGLRYSIDTPNTTLGRDLIESISRGDISGNSFSFMPNGPAGQSIRAEGGDTIRELRDLNIFDVGPVTFPAYEATSVYLRSLMELVKESPRHTNIPLLRERLKLMEMTSGV